MHKNKFYIDKNAHAYTSGGPQPSLGVSTLNHNTLQLAGQQ